jgi:hypothetical protein
MSNFKSTKTERSESPFGEVIFSYTRAQATADRVLVDVTPTALEAGFRFPVATTAALMAAVETIPQQYSHEDIEGRLWDLLRMASLAARRVKPGFSRIAFEVILHLEGHKEAVSNPHSRYRTRGQPGSSYHNRVSG